MKATVHYNASKNFRETGGDGGSGPPRLERVLANVKIVTDAFLLQLKGSGTAATLQGLREMPRVMTTLQLNFANFLGPFFFEIVLLLPFVSVVVALVYEKQQKLRVMSRS